MTALGTPGFALSGGRYLLNTDGGMRKGGEAAIGVVLNGRGDRPVTTFKERIGKETIQGAEYCALIKGLEIAFEHETGKIRVYVDNQLVVDQINDLAQVRSDHLKPLHCKAIALLKQFDDQRVYWVPRERNTCADKLVREAFGEG